MQLRQMPKPQYKKWNYRKEWEKSVTAVKLQLVRHKTDN